MGKEYKAKVVMVKSRSDDHSLLMVRTPKGAHHTVYLRDPWRLNKGDSVTIEVDEEGAAHVVDGLPS